jgi:hypothetical protein
MISSLSKRVYRANASQPTPLLGSAIPVFSRHVPIIIYQIPVLEANVVFLNISSIVTFVAWDVRPFDPLEINEINKIMNHHRLSSRIP